MSSIRKHLTSIFVGIVALMTILFFSVSGGAALLLTRDHDRLAQANAHDMIDLQVDQLIDSVESAAVVYAYGNHALEAVRVGDVDRVFDNIAGFAASDAFDLFGVIYPEDRQYGWTRYDGQGVRKDLFTSEEIAVFAGLKDAGTVYRPQSFVMRHRDHVWIFSVSKVPSYRNSRPIFDAPKATMVYGKRLWLPVLHRVSDITLVSDVSLTTKLDGLDPNGRLMLRGPSDQPVAALTWTPPTPGTATLNAWRQTAASIAIVVILIGAALGTFLVVSAQHLKRAVDRAQGADRAKTQLLANVSHELRTPMNGVVGAAQLLRDADLDSENRELVGLILSSAEAQLDLINDLLDLATLDIRARLPEPKPVDIAELVRAQADHIRILAHQKGLSIDVIVDADLPVVMLDPKLLRQILVNLLGNAVKFTDTGSVTIGATWWQKSPAGKSPRDGWLRIKVQDTGVGIPAESIDSIFERFYQVENSASRSFEGSGLGLSIVSGLVAALDGKIRVKSDPSIGTTFVVKIPCRIAAELETGSVVNIAAAA